MHALQLGTTGEILPHVDNLEASGGMDLVASVLELCLLTLSIVGTILGISLGSPRVLRLQHASGSDDQHIDVLLESGSIYVQS